jgi:flagellar hook-length control protein FliK
MPDGPRGDQRRLRSTSQATSLAGKEAPAETADNGLTTPPAPATSRAAAAPVSAEGPPAELTAFAELAATADDAGDNGRTSPGGQSSWLAGEHAADLLAEHEGSLSRGGGAGASSRAQTEAPAHGADRLRLVQRVMNALQAAEARGSAVRLRLSPPELGSLRLELAVRDGALLARLEVETSTARALLLDSLPQLRERLAAQEIKIERFEVDLMNQHASDWSPGAPEQEHAGNAGGRSPEAAGESDSIGGEAAAPSPVYLLDAAGIDVLV